MPNRIYPICAFTRFILCLFWSESGSKPFRPVLAVTHYYELKHYLFASIHFYSSILHTNIPGSKNPFANKLFLFFTTTMVWSGFGPYHGLCHQDTQCKHIHITPTLGAMTHALGLGILTPQPKL